MSVIFNYISSLKKKKIVRAQHLKKYRRIEVNNISVIPEAKSNEDWDKDH